MGLLILDRLRFAGFIDCYVRWTIETKYYSADISIWTANLGEEFSLGSLPHQDQLAALVMVFDMSDVRTELSFLTFYATYSPIVIFGTQF
jgi:hypothetical protein